MRSGIPASSTSSLVAFIDNEFSNFMRHRDGANGWTDRLITAMRVFNGDYDGTKLAEIRRFGGSDIYARLIATKCRGATSLLRDVYLNIEKPWGLQPTPDPTLPDDIMADVQNLIEVEVGTMQRLGEAPDPGAIRDRTTQLIGCGQARRDQTATHRKPRWRSTSSTTSWSRGSSTRRLAAFLVDLPLFPFACMKGPVVRVTPQVTWVDGQAPSWSTSRRCSGTGCRRSTSGGRLASRTSPMLRVIERTRCHASDLNQLIGLPGYNDAAIREVLQVVRPIRLCRGQRLDLGDAAGTWRNPAKTRG